MWKSRTGTCSLKCVFKQSGMNTPAFFRRKPYQYVRPSHTKNSKSNGSPSRGLFNGSWSATFCMTLDKLSEKLRAQITMLQRHCPAPLKKNILMKKSILRFDFYFWQKWSPFRGTLSPSAAKDWLAVMLAAKAIGDLMEWLVLLRQFLLISALGTKFLKLWVVC